MSRFPQNNWAPPSLTRSIDYYYHLSPCVLFTPIASRTYVEISGQGFYKKSSHSRAKGPKIL